MAFWLFLTAMDLLIPAIMVGFGRRFLKHPPKTINALYGYRTARSMKNQRPGTLPTRPVDGCGCAWESCLFSPPCWRPC